MAETESIITQEKLVEVSKHLLYEIDMLRRNIETLRSIEANQNQRLRTVKYSFVDSFLIHARNLYEFLYCDRRYPTDVRAGDFFPDGSWEKPAIPEDLKRWYRDMIDKRVVHLTYDRLSIQDFEQKWQVGAMYAEIEKGLLLFYQTVSPENLCSGLRDEREHALQQASKRKGRAIQKESDAIISFATGTASDEGRFLSNP